VLESDGYLLDRFKTFYAGEYGVLTFVEDHGLMQNCEAVARRLRPVSGRRRRHRESARYQHYQTSATAGDPQLRHHHKPGGYSARRNAVHIHDNNFYDNALGFTTDVFTAPGTRLPAGFGLIEKQQLLLEQLQPLRLRVRRRPRRSRPGRHRMWIAGGNDNVVRNNRFYDNCGAAPCSSPFPTRPSATRGRRPVAAGRMHPRRSASTSYRTSTTET